MKFVYMIQDDNGPRDSCPVGFYPILGWGCPVSIHVALLIGNICNPPGFMVANPFQHYTHPGPANPMKHMTCGHRNPSRWVLHA